MPRLLFGGILAAILLGLYIWSIVDAVQIVQCMEKLKIAQDGLGKEATEAAKAAFGKCAVFTPNKSYFMNSIGALISATVVGVLGATSIYEFPGEKLFGKKAEGFIKTAAAFIPSIYILVWLTCGVITVVYGFGLYETNHIPPFTEHAKAWLGTALAAGFAYFGINRDGSPAERPLIAKISLDKTALTLTPAQPSEKLTAAATDDKNNPIPNIPSDRFAWRSSDPAIATVDGTGQVTRVALGTCNITATANAAVSNECAVTCS